MKKLSGKVAIVTGASKGIGAEIAIKLAAEGAAVVVNYSSSKAEGERVAKQIIDNGSKAVAVKANLYDAKEIEYLVAESKKAFGRVDILVNNAGIYEFSPLDAITTDHFHKMYNLNVLGLLLMTQAVVREFGDQGGTIVNISSGVATLTPPDSAVYSSTKAAVDAITAVLSKELAPKKIRVNSVNPGMIITEGVKAAGFDGGDLRAWVESTTPMGRVGKVEEIAAAVLFFASDDSAYITGETLHVTGGSH